MHAITLPKRSLDDLEDHIINLATRLNAAEYEFLVAVREFDIRQGWQDYQFNNCAEWLNMKCGIVLATAREKVRVAHALFDLPKTSDAFATGALSYSNVRALTRVATARNEVDLVEYARRHTASQVEQHCRELRNADRNASTGDANQHHANRRATLVTRADGSVCLTAELTPEVGRLLEKALEIAMADVDVSAETSFVQQQADALEQVAAGYLGGNTQQSTADRYQVVVHVDETALADDGGRSDLPVETVRRIGCDSSIVRGELKKRVVSPPMKRALLSRDRRCRYPGCNHTKWLDAHHVKHWADGGETTMENLLLLCSRHHRLLHEGGYTIHRNFEGHFYFRTSKGKVVANYSHE